MVRYRGYNGTMQGVQWHNVNGTMARRRGHNGASIWGAMVQCRGLHWCGVLDRRNSVWLVLQVLLLQGLLQPGYGEVAKRFLCGFQCVTSSCWKRFWHFSSWYVHYVHFILTSGCWEMLNSEKCLFGNLGASCQQAQESAVPFFLWKDNQTTHGCIVAVSFILGPPGLQTYAFSQPNSGNCNLFVLMLFPLGPAFIIFYIWFSIFCHLSCHILSSQSSLFPVGRFLSLGWGFGAFLAFDCRCLQRGAEDEKIQWNSCAVTAHQTWKMVFNILNQIWIGFLDVHILGRES